MQGSLVHVTFKSNLAAAAIVILLFPISDEQKQHARFDLFVVAKLDWHIKVQSEKFSIREESGETTLLSTHLQFFPRLGKCTWWWWLLGRDFSPLHYYSHLKIGKKRREGM